MKFKHSTLILVLLALMFIADGANSLLLNANSNFFRVSIFVRALAEVYFLWLLLRAGRTKTLLFLLIMVLIFVLGSLAGRGLSPNYNLFADFNYFNKMLYFFIVFSVFIDYFFADEDRRKLFKLFEMFVLLQTSVLVIGFIFNIKILSAYLTRMDEVRRFGYQGLIAAQNEVSLFFIIAFFYFLIKWHYGGGSVLPLFGVFIGALLTGTRVSLAVIPSLALYLFWAGWRKRGGRSIYVIAGVLILAGLAFWHQESILKRIAPTLDYFSYHLQSRGYGSEFEMALGLLSGRESKLRTFSQVYLPRFNWANYLVGGHDVITYLTEMDFVDVFARLGIIGAILFFGNYLRCLFYPVRHGMNFIHVLFVVVWLGIAALAGHVVASAINASYLVILLLAFTYYFSLGNSNGTLRWNIE